MSEYEGQYDRRLLTRCRELEAENKRLHKALKLARETVADEVQHLINTYGDCSLTRCAKAELAEIDRALTGQGGE